jgi:hypothetical protein
LSLVGQEPCAPAYLPTYPRLWRGVRIAGILTYVTVAHVRTGPREEGSRTPRGFEGFDFPRWTESLPDMAKDPTPLKHSREMASTKIPTWRPDLLSGPS